ncbi:T-cell surface glycoprotein CD8 alpha chain [Boleophthalmus pectinirostris]|uniref:T-cell surface glycoprotein CD8 alpha chain n=1 Tax=Boleophthalmus pectinirostris TaxID=150288 RepID=UPI00243022BE|nr:T-cell surface glycoprotein CD8 alpha chain [Boleophthalmus pectinirostris]
MKLKVIFMFGILLLGPDGRASGTNSVGGSAAPSVVTVKEGDSVDIPCKVQEAGTTVVWFRVPDGGNVEYIASVTTVNPKVKKEGLQFSSFSTNKISTNTLVLKSFKGDSDAGVYSCASQRQDMKFGPVTRLQPEKTAGGATTVKTTTTTERPQNKSITTCNCPTHTESGDSTQMQCSLMILAPLAGGCGLLLLTLVCTILYCNSVRTRRCPHHYKRKPRSSPGKPLMTNTRA